MINYPYMPKIGKILYVAETDPYMQAARDIAQRASLDKTMPTGSVVAQAHRIVGRGANGSTYHNTHPCRRVALHIPTGQGYELCEGCHPKNHSEPKAIADARTHTSSLQNAVLYLWGHWWCCEPCWQVMLQNGITTVYLLERSEQLFNKDHPNSVVGRQLTSPPTTGS